MLYEPKLGNLLMYGKCPKNFNTSWLPKRARQPVQTQIRLLLVWTGSSQFAILTSILWIPVVIKQTFYFWKERRRVWNHGTFTVYNMYHYSMYWPIKKTPFTQKPNLLMHKTIVPLIVVSKSSDFNENDQIISELCPYFLQSCEEPTTFSGSPHTWQVVFSRVHSPLWEHQALFSCCHSRSLEKRLSLQSDFPWFFEHHETSLLQHYFSSVDSNTCRLCFHLAQIPVKSKCVQLGIYSKTCQKWPLKNRQNKDLNKNGCLMKVKSIAECSPWSILQYIWPGLSNKWSWKPIFSLFRVAVLHRLYCSIYLVLSLCLLMIAFAYNLNPGQAQQKCRTWSRLKLFDTQMVFLKNFFVKVDFEEKNWRQQKKQKMIHCPTGKELRPRIFQKSR